MNDMELDIDAGVDDSYDDLDETLPAFLHGRRTA